MRHYKRICTFGVLGLCLTLLNCGGEDEGLSSPPETPKSFTAVALNEQVRLTWATQEGATYNLFHSVTTGVEVVSDAKVSNVTSPHIRKGLTNGTTYYYILTAVNSAGASEPTEEVFATPLPPPAMPQGFMVEEAFKEQVTLTWTAEEDVTYDLYHSTAAGFSLASGTKISDVSPPYLHTGLTNGTKYYYVLIANNSAGASEPTDEISATPYIVQEISASEGVHTCAVVSGGAWCWGAGSSGQLGNDDDSDADTPQQVIGLTSGVEQISAGDRHTCAVVDSVAWCWGNDGSGRLGNGDDSNTDVPAQVMGLTSGVTQIAVGKQHTCALVDGGVKCWGEGGNGRLGHNEMDSMVTDSEQADKSIPTQVMGLTSGVTQIAVGSEHTCALADGQVWCWGKGGEGRLGHNMVDADGDPVDSHTPVQVVDEMGTAISGVTQISAGVSNTCMLVDGGAWCWGRGMEGQLGNGGMSNASTPVQVDGLTTGVTQISAGSGHTCAVVNGGAWCWGDDRNGQLGNGDDPHANTPQQVDGLTSGVTQISAGEIHTCAVVDGAALCWGGGGDGQIGDGIRMDRNSPVTVRDFSN